MYYRQTVTRQDQSNHSQQHIYHPTCLTNLILHPEDHYNEIIERNLNVKNLTDLITREKNLCEIQDDYMNSSYSEVDNCEISPFHDYSTSTTPTTSPSPCKLSNEMNLPTIEPSTSLLWSPTPIPSLTDVYHPSFPVFPSPTFPSTFPSLSTYHSHDMDLYHPSHHTNPSFIDPFCSFSTSHRSLPHQFIHIHHTTPFPSPSSSSSTLHPSIARHTSFHSSDWINSISEVMEDLISTIHQYHSSWRLMTNEMSCPPEWCPAEDELLLLIARGYNFDWMAVSQVIGYRSYYDCCQRWKELSSSTVTATAASPETEEYPTVTDPCITLPSPSFVSVGNPPSTLSFSPSLPLDHDHYSTTSPTFHPCAKRTLIDEESTIPCHPIKRRRMDEDDSITEADEDDENSFLIEDTSPEDSNCCSSIDEEQPFFLSPSSSFSPMQSGIMSPLPPTVTAPTPATPSSNCTYYSTNVSKFIHDFHEYFHAKYLPSPQPTDNHTHTDTDNNDHNHILSISIPSNEFSSSCMDEPTTTCIYPMTAVNDNLTQPRENYNNNEMMYFLPIPDEEVEE